MAVHTPEHARACSYPSTAPHAGTASERAGPWVLACDGPGPGGGKSMTKVAGNPASRSSLDHTPSPGRPPLSDAGSTKWAPPRLCAPHPERVGRTAPRNPFRFLRILSAGNMPGQQSSAPPGVGVGLMFLEPLSQRACWLWQVGWGGAHLHHPGVGESCTPPGICANVDWTGPTAGGGVADAARDAGGRASPSRAGRHKFTFG